MVSLLPNWRLDILHRYVGVISPVLDLNPWSRTRRRSRLLLTMIENLMNCINMTFLSLQ